jgi:hypothetical protein
VSALNEFKSTLKCFKCIGKFPRKVTFIMKAENHNVGSRLSHQPEIDVQYNNREK